MKYLTITAIIVFACGSFLIVSEQRNGGNLSQLSSVNNSWIWSQERNVALEPVSIASSVRAEGKIEGCTESTEIRSRVLEQIKVIAVNKGDWVQKGELLIQLDAERLDQERKLAQAQLELAIARKSRLVKGARPSEIEAAKKEHESTLGPLWSAERALKRGIILFEDNAIGQQDLDELQARAESLRARSQATLAQLKTLEQPAHVDDVAAAAAEVDAARSRLAIAEVRFRQCQIQAPADGRILDINVRPGEMASPSDIEPLIIMADNRQLHAVVEIDEYDALKVAVGQRCVVNSDAKSGVVAEGSIVEVEPQMDHKKMMGQWPGERNDSFARIVRIELDSTSEDLPVGLPIEVKIQIAESQH